MGSFYRAIALILLVTGSTLAQDDCDWLDKMGEDNDLYAIQQILKSTQVLPLETQQMSTLFLPTLAGFLNFALINGLDAAGLTEQLDEDEAQGGNLRGRIDSVLLNHVLMGSNIPLKEIAAYSPYETGLSLILDAPFPVTVSEDLAMASTEFSEANILETLDLCGMTAYKIDAVLLPAPLDEVPAITHAQIDKLFFGGGSSSGGSIGGSGGGSGDSGNGGSDGDGNDGEDGEDDWGDGDWDGPALNMTNW